MAYVVKKLAGKRQLYARKVGGIDGGGSGNFTPVGEFNEVFPVLVGTTQPPDIYCSWQGVAATTYEGSSRLIRLEMSETSNVPRACPVVIDPSSTTEDVVLSQPYVLFPAGSTLAAIVVEPSLTAGGSSSNTVVLKLDPDAPLEGFPLGFEPEIVRTNSTYGPDTFTLTVLNDPGPGGGFPTYSWGNGDVLVPEGTTQPFQLRLSGPATNQVRIQVQVTAGSNAVNGRDFVAFDRVESFDIGETDREVLVEFPENADNVPFDPQVNVTATLLPGSNALPGTPTSFVVTVEDNDVGGSQGTPRINFTVISQGVLEGESTVIRASLTTANGSIFRTPTRRDITVQTANIGGATSADFNVVWPIATNALVFEADEYQAFFTVEVVDDGNDPSDVGESVRFTIVPSTTGDYIVGPNNESTVVFLEEGTEATELMVEAHRSALPFRVIQGCAAVVPPASDLPEYSLTNGKRCQVVGQKKDNNGLWKSVYWYGQADGAESTPGVTGALGLRLPEAGDVAPTLEGNFPGPQDLEFTILYANGAEPYKTTLGPNGGGSRGRLTGKADVTVPNDGIFPESNASPELCRETLFINRPRLASITPALLDESGDACGMIEVVQTEYAPDEDIIVCHGRFMNGAWAASEDHLAVNKFCDGEINMLSMRVKAPPGWFIDFVDPHPQQSLVAAETVDLLKRRDEDYHFPTCSQHQFWFILRRFSNNPTFDDPIKARAEDYLRYKHIAWPVGRLGATRQGFYGEADELAIDYHRAGLTVPGSNGPVGYNAIRFVSNEQAEGNGTTAAGVDGGGELPAWRLGRKTTDGTKITQSGVTIYDGTRKGWWYGVAPAGAGEAGGVQIHGSSALVPSWGWWIRHRILLCGIMNRNRFAYRDVVNGAAGYWWTHATTIGGEAFITTHGTGAKRQAYHRPWHFHTDRIENLQFNNGPTDYSYLRLAPGATGNPARPWNTPEVEDPNEADIYRFEHISMTHIARIRQGCNDMWYGCRNWMAYRSLEEVAAYITRTYAPVDAVDQPINYHRRQYLPGHIIPEFDATFVQHRQNGYWGGFDWSVNGGGETRGYAWSSLIIAGWYAIAQESTRSRMIGGNLSGALAGKSILGSYWDFINAVTTDAGLFSRTTGSPSPSLYNFDDPVSTGEIRFEYPNFAQRRGALPLAPEFPDDQAPYQLHFHQAFFLKAISAWKRSVWPSAFTPSFRYPQLDRMLRYHEYYTEGVRAFLGTANAERGALVPYGLATSFNSNPNLGDLTEPASEAVTLPETLAGGSVWQFFQKRLRNGEILVSAQEYGYANHHHKVAGNAFHASRALSDASLLSLAPAVYGRTATGQVEAEALFEWLFRGDGADVERELTSTGGGKRYKNYGEWTFAASYIAFLLNSYT